MDIVKIVILGVLGAFLSLTLKEYKQSAGILVSVMTAVVILFLILPELEKIVSYAKLFYRASGGKDTYMNSVIKICGIACVTYLGADILKEAGLISASSVIVMAGKVISLAICIPVAGELLKMVIAILP